MTEPCIGVLGAGQLGRMIALAGIPLGHRFRFFDPAEDPCAARVGDHIRGDWNDEAALTRFAEGLHTVTWEFEQVPVETVEFLRARVPSTPSSRSLHVAQDRLREKQLFRELGLPTARFLPAATPAALVAAVRALGTPVIAKTRTGGYDGKGQVRIDHAEDVAAAWRTLGEQPLLVEGLVSFDREVSVLVARDRTGCSITWPVVDNVHDAGILRVSRAPVTDLPPALAEAARAAAVSTADALGHVGVLCLELFVSADTLCCNELAPRVHNSGHWTIEGARTSQFENHLRAVAGLPLGPTDLTVGAAAMVNYIGTAPERAGVLHTGAALHLYGKEPRPGRKVGHATATGRDGAEVDTIVAGLIAQSAQT